MNSPVIAVAWAIWRRGRRSAFLALGCVSVCVLANLLFVQHLSQAAQQQFYPFFGSLMTLSFLFLVGLFNYTEFNSAKDWHGFPYRLFSLPVPSWQLVALPMSLAVLSVELLYLAWLKLVWTRGEIPSPEWFAVLLGVYVVFYQMILWSLAGLRLTRVVILSLGGVSGVGLACVPLVARGTSTAWLSVKLLIPLMVAFGLLAFGIACLTVARQRCGGRRRQSWMKSVFDRIVDVLPRRHRDFDSPAAAQFWAEWRLAGWLLPACTAFVIIVIITPVSWFNRNDPQYTNYIWGRIFGIPLLLAYAIGKGFVKCEFWSSNLGLPQFLAVRPLSAGQFVAAKMKVAALSVALTAVLMALFLSLWLSLWANTTQLTPHLFRFRLFFPHSWPVLVILYFALYGVLIWRCLVSGFWAGLSGKAWLYFGAAALPVVGGVLLLTAFGIWSDDLDRTIQNHPNLVMSAAVRGTGWVLAGLVLLKFWLAVFSWNQVPDRFNRAYQMTWAVATLCFLTLAILSRPPFDTYRLAHLFLLAGLLVFPLARPGFAPLSLSMNRHR